MIRTLNVDLPPHPHVFILREGFHNMLTGSAHWPPFFFQFSGQASPTQLKQWCFSSTEIRTLTGCDSSLSTAPEGRIPLSCWECAIKLSTVQLLKIPKWQSVSLYQLCHFGFLSSSYKVLKYQSTHFHSSTPQELLGVHLSSPRSNSTEPKFG